VALNDKPEVRISVAVLVCNANDVPSPAVARSLAAAFTEGVEN